MTTLLPRVVLVTRKTELSALLARHATRGQVDFYLSSRGQSFDQVAHRDTVQSRAIAAAKQAVPATCSFVHVTRDDLNRFLFFPGDIIVALGQDGLVANVAKYLSGQPVLGITPDPETGEGILTPHAVTALPDLLTRTAARDIDLDNRTMVQAAIVGGDSILALNELFIGHRSHQSARYELHYDQRSEFQSSSGMIVATGTGLTGWARSIMRATDTQFDFAADAHRAAFFSREPWPSQHSGTSLRAGLLTPARDLSVTSQINDGGVIFADGIEQDFLRFNYGTQTRIGLSETRLHLVTG